MTSKLRDTEKRIYDLENRIMEINQKKNKNKSLKTETCLTVYDT